MIAPSHSHQYPENDATSCKKTLTKKRQERRFVRLPRSRAARPPCPRLRLRAAPGPHCSLRSPSLTAPHCAASGRHRPRWHIAAATGRDTTRAQSPITPTEESMANEMITAGPWAGFEVIHRYTRAQAIADGVLVDVTAKARGFGFTVPVAMTATLFADCEAWAERSDWGEGEPTAEQFVQWLLCFRMRNDSGLAGDQHGPFDPATGAFRRLSEIRCDPHRPRRRRGACDHADVSGRRIDRFLRFEGPQGPSLFEGTVNGAHLAGSASTSGCDKNADFQQQEC